MRIVKISAVWCGGCLVMNKVINEIKKEKNIEITEYDYDMDYSELEEYNLGNILPVFIFIDKNNKEFKRIIGEVKKEEIIKSIEELEQFEENN
ncbi:MAG: thioredoxin family protein [Bacilli bacterium]|nr:thioredoxin family protein [Bacilli bacterium]